MEPPEIDIQKLIDGDNAAWRAALPYLEPAAFCIARKLLNHCCPGDVEDVVMWSIERLAYRLPQVPGPFEDLRQVRAFLAKITQNKAADHYKKKCVRETPLVSDEEDGAEPSDPPDERDWERLMRDWVDAKLIGEIAFGDLLTDKEKDVFKGIYLEGLKHREIEEKYGVPVKSVGNTNNHLLAKIRKYLDGLEGGI